MPLAQGDIIFVGLSNFSGVSFDNRSDIVSSSSGVFENCSWDSDERQLVLTVSSKLDAGRVETVIISKSSGITLPLYGVQANDPYLYIGANATGGSVYKSTFHSVQGVSLFTSSALEFSPPVAGQPCEINITLTCAADIAFGDSIRVIFP